MVKLGLFIWFSLLFATDVAFFFGNLEGEFNLVVVNNLFFIATLVAFPPKK